MKILTKKKQQQLVNLIAANQIILNGINSLDGINRFQAYGKFCENSAEAIYLAGGIEALEETKEYIFFND